MYNRKQEYSVIVPSQNPIIASKKTRPDRAKVKDRHQKAI